jgi:hypothetical protein
VILFALAAAAAFDFEAVRQVDARLAGIAQRLVTANAPICPEATPAPGLVLHAIDQYEPAYRPGARAAFGFAAPVAVETVVPGSAADRAGVRANDALVAVAGRRLDANEASATSSAHRDAAQTLMEAQPAAQPLSLTLLRDRRERAVTIAPSPGCRSRFELVLGPGLIADADGQVVRIGVRFFALYSDDQVAAVVAHELAHDILRHRARLDAAHVDRGLLGEVGRNQRLIRRTEDEADRLSIHLLRNAGYDAQIAIQFWGEEAPKIDGGVFRSRTHAGGRSRAKAMAAELAAIPAGAGAPYAPPLLRTRDEPLQ